MVDLEVVVVDIKLTNHTNDDVENDIDHPLLDNEHRQPKRTNERKKKNFQTPMSALLWHLD